MRDGIRVIASDFDGTILREGAQRVEEIYFSQIRELKNLGISFIAASGRQYANLRRILAPVADDISFICENGALVAEGRRILYQNEIDRRLGLALIGDMKRVEGTQIVVSGADASYLIPGNPLFAAFLQEKVKNNVTVLDRFEDMAVPMIKISIFWPGGIPQKWERWFHERYDGRLSVVDGGNGWLDFTGSGVDKGSALRILAGRQGFGLEEVLAFGDSENDMGMLRAAGVSYVMDTAREHVKQCAQKECSLVSGVLARLIAERKTGSAEDGKAGTERTGCGGGHICIDHALD